MAKKLKEGVAEGDGLEPHEDYENDENDQDGEGDEEVDGNTGIENVKSFLAQPMEASMHACHSFRLMDDLWIDGPTLLSYDVAHSFDIPEGPKLKNNRSRGSATSAEAPIVYHGFMFSNLVDKAWLFGGHPVGEPEPPTSNDLWRFEPATQDDGDATWTRLPVSDNTTTERPYRGAGCNVPDLQRGFYLGGMVSDPTGTTPRYLHWLYEFDTENEAMRAFPVPDFVPVVNHSLVYMDTGTRGGALLALGGMIETNGSLLKAPLSSVFIFDIQSHTWIAQPVTGWDGNMDEDGTYDVAPPSGGIPRSRVSGCAVVGSAQDKSSHNVVYLGGTNETTSLPDVWVLSLPSAIWVKARLDDPFSSPKIENSCILINDRFIWMFGGCLFDPYNGMPCMGYSYDPLVYGLGSLKIAHYRYSEDGFLVHKNISEIIGGRETGNSTQTEPLFTEFSSPLLHELFTPPTSQFFNSSILPYQSDPRIARDLVTFLVAPVVVAVFLYLVTFMWPRVSRKVKVPFLPSQDCWRPSVFSQWYLLFLTAVTGLLMALVVVLAYTSQLPDPNHEHWPGGLDEDGVWTGARWRSTFIRAPTTERPPQGLISFYLDKEPQGIWSQRNATQRIGDGNYWVFTYLPTLIAVIYGRLWKVLDDEVKRIDKYARLSKPGGHCAKDTILLEYHSFWIPLSIFQALRRGHWCVAVSSLGLTLGAIMAPIIQNYTFAWTLYSGAHLNWPDTYSWQLALVDPWWYKVLVGVLGSCSLCSLFLLALLPWQETGVKNNPQGLADIVYMVPEQNSIFAPDSTTQTLSELGFGIGDRRLQLSTRPGHHIAVLEPAAQPALATSTLLNRYRRLHFLKQDIQKFHKDKVLPLFGPIHAYLTDYPLTLPFRPEILPVWILLLFTVLVLTTIISNGLVQNGRDQLWNYTIPLSPNVYLILAVFIQSITDVIDYSIRALSPFYELHKGYQSACVLFVDYTPSSPLSVLPLWDIIQGLRAGHYLLVFSIMASIATTILTVFLGSLQLSAAYYGATSFSSDQAAATGATCLVSFVLVVHAAIGWKIRGVGRRMKRPVETVGGVAPYVVFSRGLREDLERVKGETKDTALSLLKEKRYALGVWNDGGTERFGVERQFGDGGMVDVGKVL
ncbi:hypothetical protein OQA88_13493 [Cercophora sp. LCS_1]